MLVVIILLFILVLYIYVTRGLNYWKKQNVFHLKPVPFFGNLWSLATLKKNLGQFSAEVYMENRDKPYVGVYFGSRPGLIINDYSLADSIMKDFQHFSGVVFKTDKRSDPIGGVSIFATEGQNWKVARSKLSQGFTSVKLKAIFNDLLRVSKNFEKKIISEPSFDVVDICDRYSIDLVSCGTLGIDGKSLDNPHEDPMTQTLRQMFDGTSISAFKLALLFTNPVLTNLLKVRSFPPKVYDFVSRLTQEIVHNKANNQNFRNDFVDMLLEQNRKGGWEQSDGSTFKLEGHNLDAQIFIFLVANEDTVSSTLSTLLFELAKNQDIQNNARNEINQILADNNDELTFDLLKEFTYLDMIINETLRMRPAFPVVTRMCTEECILPGTDLRVPKDMPVIIPMSGFHNDDQYWTNPEKFDPERFRNPGSISGKPFLPFGGGFRICLGMRLAGVELKLGIIGALRNHRLTTKNNSYTLISKRLISFPKETITIYREILK